MDMEGCIHGQLISSCGVVCHACGHECCDHDSTAWPFRGDFKSDCFHSDDGEETCFCNRFTDNAVDAMREAVEG